MKNEVETSQVEESGEPERAQMSRNDDTALKLVHSRRSLDLDSALEIKCRRRIDLVLMPIMFISYGLQYMDKNILNTASQFGIVQDLDLYKVVGVQKTAHGNVPLLDLHRYSVATAIFYWGYLAGCKFFGGGACS